MFSGEQIVPGCHIEVEYSVNQGTQRQRVSTDVERPELPQQVEVLLAAHHGRVVPAFIQIASHLWNSQLSI